MRCDNILIYGTDKRGRNKIRNVLLWAFQSWQLAVAKAAVEKKHTNVYTELCGGTITVNVSAEDEPVWGGTYAELNVDYICSKCGITVYHGMPDKYTISEFVTKAIEKLTDEEVQKYRTAWRVKEDERDARIDETRKKMEDQKVGNFKF